MTGPPDDDRAPLRDPPVRSMSAEGYESFVVRVLVTRETGNIVRGHVTHLTSGQHLSFSQLDTVIGFIRRLAATAHSPASNSRWR